MKIVPGVGASMKSDLQGEREFMEEQFLMSDQQDYKGGFLCGALIIHAASRIKAKAPKTI
jgi:hypothetical protein